MARIDEKSLLNRVLSQKYCVYMGTISYSIYMMHGIVWWGVTQFLRFVIDVPLRTDEYGNTRIVLEGMMAEIVTFTGVALVILVSHLSYKLIESRYRK